MKLVYIAGPFSAATREGVETNIRRAEDYGIEVATLGAMPVIPHANTSRREFESLQPYEFWIDGTKELLRRCDAVFLTDERHLSSGARGEVEEAEARGIPVFQHLPALRRWLRGEHA